MIDLSFPRILYINIHLYIFIYTNVYLYIYIYNFKSLIIHIEENISCVRGWKTLFFLKMNLLFSYQSQNLFLKYETNIYRSWIYRIRIISFYVSLEDKKTPIINEKLIIIRNRLFLQLSKCNIFFFSQK